MPGDVLIGVASSGAAFQRFFAGAQGGGKAAALGWECRCAVSRRAEKTGRSAAGADPSLCQRARWKLCGSANAKEGGIKGYAHITGGGITENLPRALPDGTGRRKWIWRLLDARRRCLAGWQKPPALRPLEMLRTFNCGIGLVAVVAEASAGHVIEAFQT